MDEVLQNPGRYGASAYAAGAERGLYDEIDDILSLIIGWAQADNPTNPPDPSGAPAAARETDPAWGVIPEVRLSLRYDIKARARASASSRKRQRPWQRARNSLLAGALTAALAVGWVGGSYLYDLLGQFTGKRHERIAVSALVERIIQAESGGNPFARNKRSSATGAGQFLDGTWLDMIRAHRPDLYARGEKEILQLREDPLLAREITARFAEKNASMLSRRGMPVTPATLYLSHFAGGAGAVAVLSAPDSADAALVMAGADSTGKTTREKLVKANPFLDGFTVADLKRWAGRKMGER